MTGIVHVAGWTLVHFAWQGAAIGVAAAVGLRLLREGPPQLRYFLGCVALAAMVLSPVVTAWTLAQDDARAVPALRTLFVGVKPPADAAHDGLLLVRARGTRAAAAAPRIEDVSRPRVPNPMPAVVGAWLIGVCLLLVRLAGGCWRVRSLQTAARSLTASSWQQASDQIAARLGLRCLVRVVDAAFVDTPVVIGWLRPVVLLPIVAVSGLTPDQVHAVIAHELAHVRRHDAIVNLCQTVAETLLFYHPAVWWLSSRMRLEREHCCDDAAMAIIGDPVAYAAALAELESWRMGQPGLALAATGGSLLVRVRRLLGVPGDRPSRAGAAVTVALVLAFVVGAGTLHYLAARQPLAADVPAAGVGAAGAPAWHMVFDHPSGQMAIRGFTARDLIRYAYQLPLSRVVGGPAWLDSDALELITTVDHVPAADETPGLVRDLLEQRFALRVHEGTTEVPVFALEIARADGALGPTLQSATSECFDQRAWVAAGAPPRPAGLVQGMAICGTWDDTISSDRGYSISMADFAVALHRRFPPAIRREVVDRTGLPGVYDVTLELFKPAAVAMAVTPALRTPLTLAGFVSLPDALETQLGLKLVPATATARAIVIDDVHRPIREPALP